VYSPRIAVNNFTLRNTTAYLLGVPKIADGDTADQELHPRAPAQSAMASRAALIFAGSSRFSSIIERTLS
jgi:hypothetical protein